MGELCVLPLEITSLLFRVRRRSSRQPAQADAEREAAKQSEQRSKGQAKKKPAKHADSSKLRYNLRSK